jgi:hypothetical protein
VTTPGERLRRAREAAGFPTASQAARAVKAPVVTYIQHENDTRTYSPAKAAAYAEVFRTSPEWLLLGREPMQFAEATQVPLVGFVGGGQQVHLYPEGHEARVMIEAPAASVEAIEVQEDALGPLFNGWRMFVSKPVKTIRPGVLDALCVVAIGEELHLGVLRSGVSRDVFHLVRHHAAPLFNQQVDWAARVAAMRPGA